MKELAYGLAGLVLLAAIYFCSYFAMLTGERDIGTDWMAKPVYRFGGKTAEAFYGPAFALDRQVRPERWPAGLVPIFDLDVPAIQFRVGPTP